MRLDSYRFLAAGSESAVTGHRLGPTASTPATDSRSAGLAESSWHVLYFSVSVAYSASAVRARRRHGVPGSSGPTLTAGPGNWRRRCGLLHRLLTRGGRSLPRNSSAVYVDGLPLVLGVGAHASSVPDTGCLSAAICGFSAKSVLAGYRQAVPFRWFRGPRVLRYSDEAYVHESGGKVTVLCTPIACWQ